MATTTTNLNLIKPDYGDTADIADINGNMDILDAAVAALPTMDDMYYKNGDTYRTTTTTQFAGACSNSGKEIFWTVITPKSLENITSVTVSTLKGIIYGLSGRVDGRTSSSYNWLTSYTVTAEIIGEYAVKMRIATDGTYTGTGANEPLTVSVEIKLTMAT